jgi:hypothetical protein
VIVEAITKDVDVVKFGPELIALPEVDLAAFSVLPVDPDVAALIDEAIVAASDEAAARRASGKARGCAPATKRCGRARGQVAAVARYSRSPRARRIRPPASHCTLTNSVPRSHSARR